MSAFKVTPGPWGAALDHNSRPIVWGPGTWQIADCWHTPDGNGWGNARLIAAAPELLEALVGLISITNDSAGVAGYHLNGAIADWDEFEEVAHAINAIAKATGASS